MRVLRFCLLNSQRQLRNGWWIGLFFLLLAAALAPALLLTRRYGVTLSPLMQGVIVLLATWGCQRLRRRPLSEVVGTLDGRWVREFALGNLAGAALMAAPAALLWAGGWVAWRWDADGLSTVGPSLVLFTGVALAEELMFRGVLFQRLVAGLGPWPAQVLVAGYFWLTHSDNPGMAGSAQVLASVNIFLASLLFGAALLRTRSLAMPLGLHLMANFVQGGLLGLGVSGTDNAGLLTPWFNQAPTWLTGGRFGLEASVPGLVCVVVALLLVYRWRQTPPQQASRVAAVAETGHSIA
jgi:membrane protease YdiL (CAAX protease family)